MNRKLLGSQILFARPGGNKPEGSDPESQIQELQKWFVPDHCRMMDDSPNDPGVANAWDSSDARGAYEDRPPRAA